MRRVTRKDIAKAAGVSPTTVTYVLRDTPGTSISDRTKQRVKAVANRLGYQPDFAATSLVRRKTHVVGLLLPSQEKQFADFYSRTIAGLIDASRDTPYHFLYLGQDQPQKYGRCLAQGYVDGVIVLQSEDDDLHARAVHETGKPVVTLNFISGLALPCVSMHYEGAVQRAYEYMLCRKRRQVALLWMDDHIQPTKRAIARHRELQAIYDGKTEFIQIDLETTTPDTAFMKILLHTKAWDGFVVDGYAWGVGLARYLEAEGWTLGERFDLSFLCFGESGVAATEGALMLQAQPEEVGRQGWATMHSLLMGETVDERQKLIPFTEVLG